MVYGQLQVSVHKSIFQTENQQKYKLVHSFSILRKKINEKGDFGFLPAMISCIGCRHSAFVKKKRRRALVIDYSIKHVGIYIVFTSKTTRKKEISSSNYTIIGILNLSHIYNGLLPY